MSGSVIPVTGMRPMTTPILITTCTPTMPTIPTASRLPNISSTVIATLMPRQTKIINSRSTSMPPIKPNSSVKIEKIKSVCGSGT
ncbi:hypothetical protein D1872_335080 [compost metagenome]